MSHQPADEDSATPEEGRVRDKDGGLRREPHGPYLRPGRPVVFDTIGNSGP